MPVDREKVVEVLGRVLGGATLGEGPAAGVAGALIGVLRSAIKRRSPEQVEAFLRQLASDPPEDADVDVGKLEAAAETVLEQRVREAAEASGIEEDTVPGRPLPPEDGDR